MCILLRSEGGNHGLDGQTHDPSKIGDTGCGKLCAMAHTVEVRPLHAELLGDEELSEASILDELSKCHVAPLALG